MVMTMTMSMIVVVVVVVVVVVMLLFVCLFHPSLHEEVDHTYYHHLDDYRWKRQYP